MSHTPIFDGLLREVPPGSYVAHLFGAVLTAPPSSDVFVPASAAPPVPQRMGAWARVPVWGDFMDDEEHGE